MIIIKVYLCNFDSKKILTKIIVNIMAIKKNFLKINIFINNQHFYQIYFFNFFIGKFPPPPYFFRFFVVFFKIQKN